MMLRSGTKLALTIFERKYEDYEILNEYVYLYDFHLINIVIGKYLYFT